MYENSRPDRYQLCDKHVISAHLHIYLFIYLFTYFKKPV